MCFMARHLCSPLLLIATVLLGVKATTDPTCQKLVDKREFIRAFGSVGSSLVLFTSSGQVFAHIATDSFDEAKNKLKLDMVAKRIDEEYKTMNSATLHASHKVTLQFDNYKDYSFFIYRPEYGRARLGVKIKFRNKVNLFKFDFQGDATGIKTHFNCDDSDTDSTYICTGLIVSSFKEAPSILVYAKSSTARKMCLSMRIEDKTNEDNYTRYEVPEVDTVACRVGFKSTVTAMTTTEKKVYIFKKDGKVAVHEMSSMKSLYEDKASELGAEKLIDMADFIKCGDLDAPKPPTTMPSWDSLDFWLTNEGICILALTAVMLGSIGVGLYFKTCQPKAEDEKKPKKTKKYAGKRKSGFVSPFSRLASAFVRKAEAKKKPRKRRPVTPARRHPARRHSPLRGSPSSMADSAMSQQSSVVSGLEQHRKQQVKSVASSTALSSIVEKHKRTKKKRHRNGQESY